MLVRTRKRPTRLEAELALALEVSSILNTEKGKFDRGGANAWGNPSQFQDKINELLVKAGRAPIPPAVQHVGGT